jgi:hypothetical protein
MDDPSCFSEPFEQPAAGDDASPDGKGELTVGRIGLDRESHGT